MESCQKLLESKVSPKLVHDFCENDFLTELLSELVTQQVDSIYIIQYVTGAINEQTIVIATLLPDMTDDPTTNDTKLNSQKLLTARKDGQNYLFDSQNIGASSTPVYPKSAQMLTINSTFSQIRPLSIKDALELIPRYNGTNIPLNTFLDGCREALDVMPEGSEQDFV